MISFFVDREELSEYITEEGSYIMSSDVADDEATVAMKRLWITNKNNP